MKKLIYCLIATCLAITFQPLQSSGINISVSTSSFIVSKAAESEGQRCTRRLNEILAMDKSKLSPNEMKELRKEVISIKDHLQKLDNGIYLTSGVIIVLLLLMIVFM